METLYRKVAVSERNPNKGGTYHSNMGDVYYNESTNLFEHNYDARIVFLEWWLEEIPTAQLQADKEEILMMLEKVKMGIFQMSFDQLELLYPKIESLIQKHKQ